MCGKKKSVRKIYKTTDGYFTARSDIKKPRRVAAIDQRKDDGALAVVKIHSKKDKNGNHYVDKVVLKPEKHCSLTEDSIVESRVYIGVKEETPEGKTIFKPIFERDMSDTGDKLTNRELKNIKKEAGGSTRKNRKTQKTTLKKWRKHFKK